MIPCLKTDIAPDRSFLRKADSFRDCRTPPILHCYEGCKNFRRALFIPEACGSTKLVLITPRIRKYLDSAGADFNRLVSKSLQLVEGNAFGSGSAASPFSRWVNFLPSCYRGESILNFLEGNLSSKIVNVGSKFRTTLFAKEHAG